MALKYSLAGKKWIDESPDTLFGGSKYVGCDYNMKESKKRWLSNQKATHGNLLIDFGGKRLKIGRI